MISVEDVLSKLGVDDGVGLDEASVLERRKKYGPNGRTILLCVRLNS